MKIYFIMLLSLCSGLISAQQVGVVYDQKVLDSKILGGERKYAVYLPPSYEESNRTYPVVYLLHPAGPKGTIPNQEGWINYGQLQQYMDRAIAEGKIAPMIIVTPDANFGTERISYFNDPEGNFNFEDFFFKEFIPHIEKTYRCRTYKGSRAIAGASMGGGASLFYAQHHPELFTLSFALSAAVRDFDKSYLNARYPGVSDQKLSEWYKQYNIYDLFKEIDSSKVSWYITCGDDDALSSNNAQLHIELQKLKIPHAFRVQKGKHDWVYWRSEMPEMFEYISAQFCQ